MRLYTAFARKGWRRELSVFLGVYLVYNVARWAFVGDLPTAREHAAGSSTSSSRWASPSSAPSNAPSTRPSRPSCSSSVYLAAQFVVLPGALVWLYRRSPEPTEACAIRSLRPG